MNDNHTSGMETPEEETSPLSGVPWFVKLTWLLQVTSYSGSFFVSLAYWLVDFNPEIEQASIFTLHTHAFSSVLILIDISVIATPMRIGHFIYVIVFSISYFTFTYVYFLLGGHNPYGDRYLYASLVDWENNRLISFLASLVISILVAPFFHFVFYALYKLRTFIYVKLNKSPDLNEHS